MSVWVNAGPVQSVLMPLAIPLLGLAPVTLLTDGNSCTGKTKEEEEVNVNVAHADDDSEILQ